MSGWGIGKRPGLQGRRGYCGWTSNQRYLLRYPSFLPTPSGIRNYPKAARGFSISSLYVCSTETEAIVIALLCLSSHRPHLTRLYQVSILFRS